MSTYGDRYAFNHWLELGGSLGDALLGARVVGDVIDVSEFLSSPAAGLSGDSPLLDTPSTADSAETLEGASSPGGGDSPLQGAGGCPPPELDPHFTHRIPPGLQLRGHSSNPRIAGEGPYIVFSSAASNLPGANGFRQIYRARRGASEGWSTPLLVSSSVAGEAAANDCYDPAISDVGDVVVFATAARLDPANDTNNHSDVYVRDYRGPSPVTRIVSVNSQGRAANGTSRLPSISAAGLVVAFTSSATDLTSDPVGGLDNVYRVGSDPSTLAPELVSLSDDVPPRIANSPMRTADPSLGAVGRVLNGTGTRIVFQGAPTNWTGQRGNLNSGGIKQIYLRDLTQSPLATYLISFSLASRDVPGDGPSRQPSISRESNWVVGNGVELVFWSSVARNMDDPPDPDDIEDVFVNLLAWPLHFPFKVSRNLSVNGQDADGHSTMPVPSRDGMLVAFRSEATNLVPGDTNGWADIFVREDYNSPDFRIRRFSVTSSGAESDGHSGNADVTPDGRVVVYELVASNLVSGDTNGQQDIFETLSPQGLFIRGDADMSASLELTDGVTVCDFLFQGRSLDCWDAADANDSGTINLTDCTYVPNFLFSGGPPPPCPFLALPGCCGEDPTGDGLTCVNGLFSCTLCQ